MQLSDHFSQAEFEMDAPLPPECVYPYTRLCELLLEPIRIHFNAPVMVTSGYRTNASNDAAHGVAHSQHVATGQYCAADWYIDGMQKDMRIAFDLIRQSPGLIFDQLILEHGENGDVIHSSWSRAYNRREALEGATANQSAYTPWPSVAADA